jgi:hypothetical protein
MARIFSKVEELFEEIRMQYDEVNAGGNAQIEYQIKLQEYDIEQIFTLSGSRVGLLVIWFQPVRNLLDGSILGVREFNEKMIIPLGNIRRQHPEIVNETKYAPEISRALEYGWKPQRGRKDFLSSKELASQCVIQFLDLVDRDRDGKVRRKSRY